MSQAINNDAVVLVSGGQDSATCLIWALNQFDNVHAISFFYNQKHSIEIEAAEKICHKLKVPHKTVDLSFMKDLVISNLLKNTPDVNSMHVQDNHVPSSFVPYRNLLFLTLASAWAGTVGARHVVIGVCETDYSGYADCRDIFVKSAQVTLNLATDFKEKNVIIHTPLMWLSKGEEFALAEKLGCLDLVLNDTISCYNGIETIHPYGKGCGDCPACHLRKKGYEEFLSKKENR